MGSDDIIKIIEADGWFAVAQRGSHIQFLHTTKPGKVTVPANRKDLPKGTVNAILRQAGLK
ncbi:type II toxin-antitoxin system HicA family toxin [Fretibacterium sp. OH1220_COT-178]|uniref:type II toxin-antitoxin system HicA family toxin n=1 Tax=Fretibacterium sp. OH1220_COT-178 TaxID=2491047 RepID=UPI000F5E10CB|nr:type II toxin-antitoxin system HicA family toxin [Fretibacterium sp. OH1220_COT-178]RRD64142.1 type II toxin-antitoxin system HicA family toxin [Fretibacterium sp. OH1220_COT-178]